MIDEYSEKSIKLISDFALEQLSDFNDGNTKNPLKFGCAYESADVYYEIKMVMRHHQKHTCEDCIYNLGDECYFDDYDLSMTLKKYCPYYEPVRYCWECKNWNNYGCDESWCDIDMGRNFKYSYDYNEENKCPDWELDK